jgi:hypothetical protein
MIMKQNLFNKSHSFVSRLLVLSLIAFLLLSTYMGCASKMAKLEEPKELPSDIDKPLMDQFAVKEVSDEVSGGATPHSASSATPVALPTPVTSEVSAKPVPPLEETTAGKKSKKKPKKIADEKKSKELTTAKTAPAPTASQPKEPFQFRKIIPPADPYPLGELLTYEVAYFGVVGGILTLESMPHKQVNDREVYHIKGVAVTSKVFSLFYKMDDTIESFIDTEGFFSHRFNLKLDESIQTKTLMELYDSEKGQTFFWSRGNHSKKGPFDRKETKEMPPFPQDFISALYYLRAIPLPNGKDVHFPFMQEGGMQDASCLVLRREKLDTPWGEEPVIVIRLFTYKEGVKQQKEESYLYITDDEKRLPVRLEAKVRVGTVTANLVKWHRK